MTSLFALLFLSPFFLPAPPSAGELIWSEEFDHAGLPDSTVWAYDAGDGCPRLCGWGNREIQHYTVRDPRTARVEDGRLIIEAHKGRDGRWTSARLKTQGKRTFRYGRIVIRARIPAGAGVWPALWMLGHDITSAGWPACGEIDIMEHVGKNPGQVHGSLHSPSSYGATENTGIRRVEDFDQAFHTYEVNWTPDNITFLIDGYAYYTYNPPVKDAKTWPFDKDFFFILNIAIGGNWGSDPRFESKGLKNGVDPRLTTARMEVDYIRVYR